MLLRRACAALAAAVAAVGVAGCGTAGASGDERPSVAAAFYPLAFAAERVGGPDVRVTDLTNPGVEPHDLELTARQVGEIANADLVVYEQGFQPAVDEAVEQNASGAEVEITGVVPIERAGDPHVWLDPTRFATITEAIAEALEKVAPEKSDGFRERANALVDELTELDDDFREHLADCQRKVVVTAHDAFGYLADRYGLTMVGISGLSPDAEPSPARLKEIRQVIEDQGVTTVFYERLVSPDVAKTLAADLGVSAAVLDPIEGLTAGTGNEDYLTLMRANLAALEKANGCR